MIGNFKQIISEDVKNDDIIDFQKNLKTHLSSILESSLIDFSKTLNEEDDFEMRASSDIQKAARSNGASYFSYSEGVFDCSFSTKADVFSFAQWLDAYYWVTNYEISVDIDGDGILDDFDAIEDNEIHNFTVTVYIDPKIVRFSGGYDEFAESTETDKTITEIARAIHISHGKKVVKMECPPGQKYNPNSRKCERISSAEHMKMSKRSKKVQAHMTSSKRSLAQKSRKKSLKKLASLGI